MLFSILIPTCNRNDLLALCLDLLAPGKQTINSDLYEVIVSDDGKGNPAKELIAKAYPWVKWIEGPKKGPASNRNKAALLAKGEWLVFTDDDCLPQKDWLSEFHKAMQVNSPIEVYEGKVICSIGLKSPLDIAPINLTGGYLWSCNMMIQKAAFIGLGGFSENYPFPHMEDVDFRNKVQQSGRSVFFVNTAVIDHPPRKAPMGNILAKRHESGYYYKKIVLKERYVSISLLKEIVITRVRGIIRYRISNLSFIAVYSMFLELFCTIIYLFKWNKKYSYHVKEDI